MIIAVFLLGLCVGSFLNVVIDRLPNGQSIIFGRSHCDTCQKNLKWYDLIPLLSFIILLAKCRYCKTKLTFQYPLVELITGSGFCGIYLFNPLAFYPYIFYSCMIIIFFTDLKYRIIPGQILAILLLLTPVYLYLQSLNFIPYIASGFISLLFFLLLVIVTRGRGMGMGDVKYAFVMGFILGPTKTVIGLYTAFLTGGVISIILLITGRKKMKSTIPFGPFLVGGSVISFFWGDRLWQIVSRMMGI